MCRRQCIFTAISTRNTDFIGDQFEKIILVLASVNIHKDFHIGRDNAIPKTYS
jgi:hypothetical protein